MIKTLSDFVKKNAVLVIAIFAAVITCFIIPPDVQYIGYFDFRVNLIGRALKTLPYTSQLNISRGQPQIVPIPNS